MTVAIYVLMTGIIVNVRMREELNLWGALLQHELALEQAEVSLHLPKLHLLVLNLNQIHNSLSMHRHVQHVLVSNLQAHCLLSLHPAAELQAQGCSSPALA